MMFNRAEPFRKFVRGPYKKHLCETSPADLQNQAELAFIHYFLLLNISFTWILLRLKNLELL